MSLRSRLRLAAVLALAAIPAARANVRLPYILAEHMVVQRGLPVHIWGGAAPGEAVTVTFRGEHRAATADSLGRWGVYLPPGDAGGPFTLEVKGNNTIAFEDVLVGDVWVAAGQSNMEWPVSWAANAAAEIAAAGHPRIRLARAMHRVSRYPLDNFVGRQWAPCSPVSVPDFSAVGYYFGRHLHEKTGVPIGVIQAAWGGTPAEAWTSQAALSADPALMPVFAEWARMTRDHETALARFQRDTAAWRAAGSKAAEAPVPPKGPGGWWEPGVLFNAMVAPLTRYPIRGVIWYQGESNTASERAPVYGRLFEALIRDWRRAWGQGDFPFLFVQLANYRTPPEAMWPELRESQRRALALAGTAMAVTIDIGEPSNIHPANKQEVGAAPRAGCARGGVRGKDRVLRAAVPAGHTRGRGTTALVRPCRGAGVPRYAGGFRDRWFQRALAGRRSAHRGQHRGGAECGGPGAGVRALRLGGQSAREPV